MEDSIVFEPELFQDALVDFVLMPLPVTMSLEDASFGLQVGNEPTSSRNKRESDDEVKREIRRRKDRIRRQRSTQRRKCERQALLWQVDELSKQIQEIKCKSKKDAATSAWKAAASRQRNVLQSCMDDRRLLRDEVNRRAAIMDDLRSLLLDQVGRAAEVPDRHVASQAVPLLVQQYVRELETVYRQTDETFQTTTADSTSPQSSMFNTTRSLEGCTEYFQSCAKQLMPFEFGQTCHYLWQLVFLAHRQEDRQHYEEVDDPQNTTAVKFRISMAANAAAMLIHCAIRRYKEESRMVIVWRALTEGEGSFAGLHSDETGWCVVHPSTSQSCTVVESCTRVVPMSFGAAPALPRVANEFTESVVKSGEEDILQIAVQLDRVLLDEALEHIDVASNMSEQGH